MPEKNKASIFKFFAMIWLHDLPAVDFMAAAKLGGGGARSHSEVVIENVDRPVRLSLLAMN